MIDRTPRMSSEEYQNWLRAQAPRGGDYTNRGGDVPSVGGAIDRTAAVNVLCIDPGRAVGWATPTASGSFTLKKGKGEHRDAWHGRLFDEVSARVADLITEHEPSIICLEEFGSELKGDAAAVLLGIRAVVLVIARRRELLLDTAHTHTWHSWARKRGYEKADDRADAVWMKDWWLAVRAPLVRSEAA